MRRQDREGVLRSAYQGHVNAKMRACYVENDSGWWVPNTVEDGFEALNTSLWWLHYRALWFATKVLTPQSTYEFIEARRNVRIYLDIAHKCPGPRLP